MRFCLLLILPVLRATTCEGLGSLVIPQTTVAAAPAESYCRVTALVHPVAGSEIQVEVWLPPPAQWNGKLLGTGNGGYASALSTSDMRAGLNAGYAVAGSDTGHQGGDLKFGVQQPEKIRDWGYRAVHVMTETAKLLVHAYYGRFAAQSYFLGCSTGGHQALMEAQRYPDDYDGIVAGAPGNNRVRLNVAFLWNWLAVHRDGADLPAAKLPLIHNAVLAACGKDGVIADPRACRWDPNALLCRDGAAASCLTSGEVAAVRAVYEGPRNPRTGEQLAPGWARGTETGWTGYFVGQKEPARLDFWKYWVFADPAWDFHNFDFDRDVTYADRALSFLVANNPDLTPFQKHGGKLLLYHGWADPVAPTADTIRYWESVKSAMGSDRTSEFTRLFLIPGMGHCGGGPAPAVTDRLGALDTWVTSGQAPERLAGTGPVR